MRKSKGTEPYLRWREDVLFKDGEEGYTDHKRVVVPSDRSDQIVFPNIKQEARNDD